MGKAVKTVMSGIISILAFLVFWAVANILSGAINNQVYHRLLAFVNNIFIVIIVMILLFMIGDIFSSWVFPFNIPYPIFSAAGSIFFVKFLREIILFIDELVKFRVFGFVESLFPEVYYLVFWIALIVGYVKILMGVIQENKEKKKEKERKETPWEDILGDLKKDVKEVKEKVEGWGSLKKESGERRGERKRRR